MKLTKKDLQCLLEVHKIFQGITSEYGPSFFEAYSKLPFQQLEKGFMDILEKCGVKFITPTYEVEPSPDDSKIFQIVEVVEGQRSVIIPNIPTKEEADQMIVLLLKS